MQGDEITIKNKNMYLKDKTLKKRYSIFPIVHQDLWNRYKEVEKQTWVAEETEHAGDVAEMALAHKIASSVEASYRRGNLMARRRRLMDDWEKYCFTPYSDNVINFERIAA